MADDFNNFYGDLEEETTIRKQAEEQRVVRMERELGKIENVLATETKRRIEASKALQTMFEAKVVAPPGVATGVGVAAQAAKEVVGLMVVVVLKAVELEVAAWREARRSCCCRPGTAG